MVSTSFIKSSVKPPIAFRLFILFSLLNITKKNRNISHLAKHIESKNKHDQLSRQKHSWEIACQQLRHESLLMSLQKCAILYLLVYFIEIYAALTHGWNSYPAFGKNTKQLLQHHVFTVLFLISFIFQGYQIPHTECPFYNDIFCNNIQQLYKLWYVNGVECLGITETLLPEKYVSTKRCIRCMAVGWIIPFAFYIGPKYSYVLSKLIRKEITLAKQEDRKVNIGFVLYATLISSLILILYPSFGWRAGRRLKHMGFAKFLSDISL